MRAPFDLFRKDTKERFAWLEAATDLSAAKMRLRELGAQTPGEYLILDYVNLQIIETLRKGEQSSGVVPLRGIGSIRG